MPKGPCHVRIWYNVITKDQFALWFHVYYSIHKLMSNPIHNVKLVWLPSCTDCTDQGKYLQNNILLYTSSIIKKIYIHICCVFVTTKQG